MSQLPKFPILGKLSFVIVEEVPGFFVLSVFGGAAVGSEEEFELTVGGSDGDDEPDGHGNNVSGDEVELVGAVSCAVRVDVTFKRVAAAGLRGFDLDAQEVGARAGFGLGDDGDVVRGGVSPGTGNGEPLLGGAGHEEELGPFALLFVVSEGGAGIRHIGPWVRSKVKGPTSPKEREKWGSAQTVLDRKRSDRNVRPT